MREIKFRAWLKKEKMMIKWYPQFFSDTSPVTHYSDEFPNPEDYDDIILMQYTGLHDKNGKEIYEGDILKVIFENHSENFRVDWSDIYAGWDCEGVSLSELLGMEHGEITHNVEIIGNIYENPELLKEIDL